MWPRIHGALILMLWSLTAAAIEQLQLQWDTIESASWRLRGVDLHINLSDPDRPSMTLEVASFETGAYRFERLRLSCSRLRLLAAEMACLQGKLSATSDWLEAEAVPASISYHLGSRDLTVSVSALPVGGGDLRLAFHQQPGSWQLSAELSGTSAGGLAELLQMAGLETQGIDYQGLASGEVNCDGDSRGLKNITWDMRTQGLGYSNADGTQAGEQLVLFSRGSVSPREHIWRLKGQFAARQGMLYAEPVYLEFSEASPLELTVDLQWHADKRELLVESLAFEQPGIATGNLEAAWLPGDATPLRQLSLQIQQAWLPRFYDTWLQPWVVGNVLEKLETEGRLRGELKLADGRPKSILMQLEQLTLREPNGQFGVQGLDGDLRWDDSGAVKQSRLAWQGANFYRLPFGSAELAIEADDNSLRIRQPLVVSLLDGELHVDEFELGVEQGKPRWLLDGMLTPVSMQAFSSALGWLPLSRKLSGMVPQVRYEHGELTLGGVLLVRAFDGDITLRNLRIEQPLGLVPRLWADARVENIDLKTLTRTFSFGRIEGKLQGRVDGLYMEAWQLVAFDAALQTPPGDGSRHRISQKAVDNISNLGGAGVGGAVSRSFMRFLEDFPYRRLGIRCRLENNICHMDGVAPAESGYYLVQGDLLPPRLDVIGYASEVDWSSLLGRLQSITSGKAPVVQ